MQAIFFMLGLIKPDAIRLETNSAVVLKSEVMYI